MPGIDPGLQLAQWLNGLVLALALAGIVVVPAAVGRHARRNGLAWARTVPWVAVSLALFPLGVGLYLLLARPAGQADGRGAGE